MFDKQEMVLENVIRDMSEGVIAIGFDGVIIFSNPSAGRIMGIPPDKMSGRTFLNIFMEDESNDAFSQMVINAVYDKKNTHNEIVPFHSGDTVRQLHMVSSCLYDGEEPVGIIIVLDDITELSELKIEYARQVTSLLDSLVGALSTAIDARSPYNANHTRNMVHYAENFLDYLEQTNSDWIFDENHRRAFLMSVWLHDVGKLAVPLEIMDKPTRLGPAFSNIQKRFTEMSLLDRIAWLEGRMDEGTYETMKLEREETLAFVERINRTNFLTDEELVSIQKLSEKTYVNEQGEILPWLTDEELTDLRIRKGTLTDEERAIMQSHVTVTEHILGQVDFPAIYAQVPAWASAHHEQLNGKGYPHHLTAPDIPREVRLLTILDVFDALTAKDRPYKTPMPPEKALGILRSMVQEGAVDAEILALYESSKAWENRDIPEERV